MSVNSLDKVASYSPYGQRNAFAAAVEPCAKPAALPAPSPKASMRRMKADETLAIALQAAPAAKILGEVDFSQKNHVDTNVLVTTGSGVGYNSYYGQSWLMNFRGASFIQAELNVVKDPSKTYTLDLNHLSSLVNGKPLSKITIEVNGQVVVAGHNPNNGDYIHEKFDITKFVKDGKNEIKLKLDSDAYSNYWINHLTVLESS
jgi:hypothetical protein